jgi:hypothetical protein
MHRLLAARLGATPILEAFFLGFVEGAMSLIAIAPHDEGAGQQ